MGQEPEQIIGEVSKLLFACLYDLQRTVMQDWQSLDLTMAQIKVLLTLSFKGPMAISKLAEALSISHPTASHLVDKLTQAGLVRREESAADRRSNLAQLSQAGEQLARRLWQGRMSHLNACLAQLGPQELEGLRQGLQALSQITATMPGQPPTGAETPEAS